MFVKGLVSKNAPGSRKLWHERYIKYLECELEQAHDWIKQLTGDNEKLRIALINRVKKE